MTEPIKLKIVKLPLYRHFALNERINFYGLLCKLIYSDGTEEFLTDQWLEYDKNPTTKGIYNATVYLDKNHKYNLCTKFKFFIIDEKEEK